jgi:hypothetical protein
MFLTNGISSCNALALFAVAQFVFLADGTISESRLHHQTWRTIMMTIRKIRPSMSVQIHILELVLIVSSIMSTNGLTGLDCTLHAHGQLTASSMRPITLNSVTLKSTEYWVFEGNVPFRYPDDVIRGFYPPEIQPSAISCAEEGFDQIANYLRSGPDELQSAISAGITRTIVLSVNDYTFAANDRIPRSPKLSHWGLDRDLSQGYWRWEVTLNQEGECLLPRIQLVREVFRTVLRPAKLSQPPREA